MGRAPTEGRRATTMTLRLAGLLVGAVLATGACNAASPATTSSIAALGSDGPSTTPVASPTTASNPGASATPSVPAPIQSVGGPPVQLPLGLAAMTVTSGLRVRSQPDLGEQSIIYQPLLPRGTRFRLVEGPEFESGYWWYRVGDIGITLGGDVLDGWVASADQEGIPWIAPSPEACLDFGFATADITIQSLAELQGGMLGTWAGCVTTPWVPPYWVTITFRDDGTYSGVAQPDQLGDWQPAFYYGTDEDSPEKRYELIGLQDSLKGVGQIDIFFSEGNTNRGYLPSIKLMGDQLEFEFFHRGQYGPLTYRLYRLRPDDSASAN